MEPRCTLTALPPASGHLTTPARRRTGRWARRCIALLAAGAALTIAIAWACASAVRLPATGRVVFSSTPGSLPSTATWWSRPGAIRFAFIYDTPSVAGTWDRQVVAKAAADQTAANLRLYLEQSSWPAWGRAPDPAADPSIMWAGVVQDARGWPAPAMWCEWTYDSSRMRRPAFGPRVLDARGGVDLTARTVRLLAPTDLRAIPLRPVWWGLILDTLFYAAVLAIPVAAAGPIRARHRRGRNRCPRCGYSLAGQRAVGCPECGWKRADETAPAA